MKTISYVSERGRTCIACKKFKTWTDYNRDNKHQTQHRSRCRECDNAYSRQYYQKRIEQRQRLTCSVCKTNKDTSAFHRSTASKTGFRTTCVACDKARKGSRTKVREAVQSEQFHCGCCDQIKPKEDFSNLTKSIRGKQAWCKACFKKYERPETPENEIELVIPEAAPAEEPEVQEEPKVQEEPEVLTPQVEEEPIHVGPVSTNHDWLRTKMLYGKITYIYELTLGGLRDRDNPDALQVYLKEIRDFINGVTIE